MFSVRFARGRVTRPSGCRKRARTTPVVPRADGQPDFTLSRLPEMALIWVLVVACIMSICSSPEKGIFDPVQAGLEHAACISHRYGHLRRWWTHRWQRFVAQGNVSNSAGQGARRDRLGTWAHIDAELHGAAEAPTWNSLSSRVNKGLRSSASNGFAINVSLACPPRARAPGRIHISRGNRSRL